MENSVEQFLKTQKDKLETDKNRLNFESPRSRSSRSSSSVASRNKIFSCGKDIENPDEIIKESDRFVDNEHFDNSRKVSSAKSVETTPRSEGNDPNSKSNISVTPNPEPERDVCPFELYDNLRKCSIKSEYVIQDEHFLNKTEKNKKNERQTRSLDRVLDGNRTGEEDVMEQWVSDTFYSYFPSFSKYNKKKEELARDRHIEYQNYLKQVENTEPKKKISRRSHNEDEKTDKIITHVENVDENVNNYNGNPEFNDNNARPGSARHKLLEDLKHTDLLNIINSDAIDKRNRRSAENEVKKKLEYQRDLMRQIEEKRREVELIREREKHQEELLTKRLEEQLKTMKLEEELEKETLKSEKMRIASEQNQILRAHLLSKLETENKRYTPYDINGNNRKTQSEGGKDSTDQEQNKVYKYFSNSARQQKYNKYGSDNFLDNDESDTSHADHEIPFLDSEQEDITARRRCKSYQPNNTTCTFCNSKLRIFDNYCTKCKIRITEDVGNYYKRCENCKDRFFICNDCEKRFVPCMMCHRQRNFCYDCMRNLCLNCHRPAKDHPNSSTRSDANAVAIELDRNDIFKTKSKTKKPFKVLDIDNYDLDTQRSDFKASRQRNSSELLPNKTRPPYSMNHDENSIFHPENKVIEPKIDVLLRNNGVSVNKSNDDKRNSLEFIKHKTNDRLSRYVKNYGDLRVKNADTSRIPSEKVHVENVYLTVPRSTASLHPKDQPSKIPVSRTTFLNEQQIPATSNYFNNSKVTKWKLPGMQRPQSLYDEYETFTQVGVIRKQLEERFQNKDGLK